MTAGEELIPEAEGLTQYEPWIEEFGNVVFGSPGRATVVKLAAVTAMARLSRLRDSLRDADVARGFFNGGGVSGWDARISMHFATDYDFDDSECR